MGVTAWSLVTKASGLAMKAGETIRVETLGGGGYGDRDRGPREMFSATCSSCGKDAQVPFRPTSGKPVYCSDCFRSMRG